MHERQLPESCGPDSGRALPVIDRNRCEGKADCVAVCPFGVFEIATVPKADRAQMSLVGRVKLAVHGGQQAYAVNAADCHACGRCLSACPESAISLVRAS
jgi:NAD-dependent dihydropyrimidine dehydrogenase PreA subunit